MYLWLSNMFLCHLGGWKALYRANKYRFYKGPHWLKLKTHPNTQQKFVEFLVFLSL